MNKNLTIPALVFLGTLLSTGLAADHFESIDRYQRQNGTSTLRTDLVASKETAYQQGHQIKSALSRQSAYQLHRTLRVPVNRLDVRSVKIDDSYVTVQELSRDPGQIEYQGMVVVRYHYRTHADR
ncbi:DUF3316 domain-containing protein [Photobacterium atrarenae]|uniref:DUF3316 domain-containing protein n=1 Tax=Photobacterium atrarenae TaxID=865757 RepID=A0ABY5GJW2_9GAMM|nr:DUF3316 domain-containing protein [Photobacterium atrarenae]UTV29507.1 DUF3316 domain-containing protein [Photobacterium atrarenae]